MNQNTVLVLPILVITLGLCGCQPKSGESEAGGGSIEIGPKYSAKHGLHVPEDTRRSLGLEIVDVTEEQVPATLNVQLRVYEEDRQTIFASAMITQDEAKGVKAGLEVQAALNGTNLTGRVTGVDERLRTVTGMIEVLVELTRTDHDGPVGAFLAGHVALESEATLVSIPRTALLESIDGHSVYTESGENFTRTPVKVGAMTSELVEIKDGLYAGDRVVAQPVMALWMTELAAVKGGQACCVVPAKGK